mmetsp:Transcript_2502/g.5055  ORF Transcript_2502/g.5055 Transcript_2502/m.5055 type:complete len:200 (+) Transcript_2502:2139-2738(+)
MIADTSLYTVRAQQTGRWFESFDAGVFFCISLMTAYFQSEGNLPPSRMSFTAASSSSTSQSGASFSISHGIRSSPGDFQLGKVFRRYSKSPFEIAPLILSSQFAGILFTSYSSTPYESMAKLRGVFTGAPQCPLSHITPHLLLPICTLVNPCSSRDPHFPHSACLESAFSPKNFSCPHSLSDAVVTSRCVAGRMLVPSL